MKYRVEITEKHSSSLVVDAADQYEAIEKAKGVVSDNRMNPDVVWTAHEPPVSVVCEDYTEPEIEVMD